MSRQSCVQSSCPLPYEDVYGYRRDIRRAARQTSKHNRLRYRATVVVIQDSKLLLVRDKGRRRFSMPGGGFKHGESTVQAGIRELGEEVGGLDILGAERLRYCDMEGHRAKHKVCRVFVEGRPYVRQCHEIDKVIWWNMKSKLPTQGHVKYILRKLGVIEPEDG